jgi:predicted site-specific integrase-resolvase
VNDVPDEYDPRRDGELLSTGVVMRLLGFRSRDTVMEWRKKGLLRGYRLDSGHYRYPSRQPALVEARAALAPWRRAAR